jgi:ABC-type transporter Mla subunit MlaD
MVTQTPSRRAVALVIGFTLSCFCLTLYVWTRLGGSVPFGAHGYRLHALFAQASQLGVQADVRISGVSVGKVVGIRQAGDRTDVTIQMASTFAPVPSDTRAILRQKTLLGETFIALTPGSQGAAKLRDGGTLPIAAVAATQQLDQVLSAFDAPTRRNLKLFLTGSSTSLSGRGQDLNAALGYADPAVSDLGAFVTILDQQQGAVGRLVSDTGTALRALGRRQADLESLVTSGEQALSATAARGRQLTATVTALPPFVRALRSSLGAVDRTTQLAGPSLAALRPAAPLLRPALRELIVLSPRVRALLAELGRFNDTAQTALPAATHLTQALHTFTDVLFPAAQQVVPVIDLILAYQREVVATAANVGAATEATGPSGLGTPLHYLRTIIPVTNESFVGVPQRAPSNRHNPYFAPGGLAAIAQGGLLASDCRNTSNPQSVPMFGGGAPPCRVQPGWVFQGQTRYYPHVSPAAP